MKIVNVMTPTLPYELYWDKPHLKFNWDTNDGRWVGMGGYDWLDLKLWAMLNWERIVWSVPGALLGSLSNLLHDRWFTRKSCKKIIQ